MAESSHSSISMSIPVLYGDNYDFWSIKMKTFFQSQDLWEIVQDGYEMFPRIMGATSAKEEFHGSEKNKGDCRHPGPGIPTPFGVDKQSHPDIRTDREFRSDYLGGCSNQGKRAYVEVAKRYEPRNEVKEAEVLEVRVGDNRGVSECSRSQTDNMTERVDNLVTSSEKETCNKIPYQNIPSVKAGKKNVTFDPLFPTIISVEAGGERSLEDKGKGKKGKNLNSKSLWFPRCKGGIRIGGDRRRRKVFSSEEESSSSGLDLMRLKGPNYVEGETSKVQEKEPKSPSSNNLEKGGPCQTTIRDSDPIFVLESNQLEGGLPKGSDMIHQHDQVQDQDSDVDYESFVAETPMAFQGRGEERGINLCVDLRSSDSVDLGSSAGCDQLMDLRINQKNTGGRNQMSLGKNKRAKGLDVSVRNQSMKSRIVNNHMTGDASIFCDIDASNKSQVRLGNGALVEVKGKGNIAIETKKGRRFIKNVLIVPNLQQNFLSMGQMIQNGYSLHFEGDSCTIYDSNNKSTVIARVKMENQNFPIRWSYATEATMKVQLDDSWLWHRRCPTKAVQNKTPVEAWSGRKPSAKHLRVFGSICYVHIPKEKRSNLDDKTEKEIFVGYSSQSKGYRIYNLKSNKIIISRDVEFDENAAWN
ncbi:hypothetical protein EZV62_023431 [Acer yangbiense]|uniref:Uncharacterized protein n=1 Tax=Acer yangbiense TaxID=1000413 RepID=A0A5C7H230_9ROSI|nr:hypothetical protein EZV62_023431 [Acer yangbiense]